MLCVCHAVLSVHCSLVVTCWERTNLLTLLYVKFSCVFVIFPCGVLSQVWYMIVLIPDRFAASDLVLHCLQMSHKKDSMVLWFNS